MNGSMHQPGRSEACREWRADFQAYVDGELARERSLELFLHARDCAACAADLAELKALFARLGELPPLSAPVDFDAAVLAAVPYAAYREMEPLRRERVPVFLDEEFLPAALRAPAVRLGGFGLALLVGVGLLAGRLPGPAVAVLPIGLLPEALLRLQRLARRRFGRVQRSESG